tara:strand:- start:23 stop:334 length:312 start_codon:yes stop_codon:yes gene_type:complete
MGAELFFTMSSGRHADEAFEEARRRARYDHGHSGQTGTINEKSEFTVIPVPDGTESFHKFANELIDNCDPRVDDKWGPAGCIETGVDGEMNRKLFLFFGWASS